MVSGWSLNDLVKRLEDFSTQTLRVLALGVQWHKWHGLTSGCVQWHGLTSGCVHWHGLSLGCVQLHDLTLGYKDHQNKIHLMWWQYIKTDKTIDTLPEEKIWIKINYSKIELWMTPIEDWLYYVGLFKDNIDVGCLLRF